MRPRWEANLIIAAVVVFGGLHFPRTSCAQSEIPETIRPGERFTLEADQVLPNDFVIGDLRDDTPSLLQIRGGTVGANATAHAGSQILLFGGKIENGFLLAGDALVEGGSIGEINVLAGGSLEIAGGDIGAIRVQDRGLVEIRGGMLPNTLEVRGDSLATLYVREFGFGGNTLISGSLTFNGGRPQTPLNVNGVLADGTPISFEIYNDTYAIVDADSRLRFTIVPEPNSLFCVWFVLGLVARVVRSNNR